jgi:hypothetical protein
VDVAAANLEKLALHNDKMAAEVELCTASKKLIEFLHLGMTYDDALSGSFGDLSSRSKFEAALAAAWKNKKPTEQDLNRADMNLQRADMNLQRADMNLQRAREDLKDLGRAGIEWDKAVAAVREEELGLENMKGAAPGSAGTEQPSPPDNAHRRIAAYDATLENVRAAQVAAIQKVTVDGLGNMKIPQWHRHMFLPRSGLSEQSGQPRFRHEGDDVEVLMSPERQKVRAELNKFAECALDPTTSSILLSGPSGIGKSYNLLGWVVERRRRGDVVLYINNLENMVEDFAAVPFDGGENCAVV